MTGVIAPLRVGDLVVSRNFNSDRDPLIYGINVRYQWLNASSAAQNNEYNGQPPFQNLTEIYSSLIQPSGELVPVLTWSLTGLDPLQEHTIGVEHFATPGKNTFITFDYMIVSQSTLDARLVAL